MEYENGWEAGLSEILLCKKRRVNNSLILWLGSFTLWHFSDSSLYHFQLLCYPIGKMNLSHFKWARVISSFENGDSRVMTRYNSGIYLPQKHVVLCSVPAFASQPLSLHRNRDNLPPCLQLSCNDWYAQTGENSPLFYFINLIIFILFFYFIFHFYFFWGQHFP